MRFKIEVKKLLADTSDEMLKLMFYDYGSQKNDVTYQMSMRILRNIVDMKNFIDEEVEEVIKK